MAKNNSEPKEEKVGKPVEDEETVKAEEPKSVEPVEEPKAPQFKNNSGKGIKIKLVDEEKNFKWITVKPGESVTIPKKIAKANGLVRVE